MTDDIRNQYNKLSIEELLAKISVTDPWIIGIFKHFYKDRHHDLIIYAAHIYSKIQQVSDIRRYIIITHVQMMSSYMFDFLNLLCQWKYNSTEVFGGSTVLIIGDLLRIGPIPDNRVKQLDKDVYLKYMKDINIIDSHTYRDIFNTSNIYHLNTSSTNDSDYDKIIKRIRISGTSGYNRNSEEYVNSDILTLNNVIGGQYNPNILHMYGTNKSVNTHNDKMLHKIDGSSHIFREKCTYYKKIYFRYSCNTGWFKLENMQWPGLLVADDMKIREYMKDKLKDKLNVDIVYYMHTDKNYNGNDRYALHVPVPYNQKAFQSCITSIRRHHEEDIEIKLECIIILTDGIYDYDGTYIPCGTRGIIKTYDDRSITVSLIGTLSEHLHNNQPYRIGRSHKSSKDGDYKITSEQFPIKLGYATTIHKAQGMKMSTGLINVGKTILSERTITNCFTDGMAYSALSLVSSLDDLVMTNIITSSDLKVNKHLLQYELNLVSNKID